MEEYLKVSQDLSASEGSISPLVRGQAQNKMKAGLHRHESLIYGLQFQKKVALFAVQSSQSTTIADFQSISREQLYKKVLSFLQLAVQDSAMLDNFIKPFKILDQEMQLEIQQSVRSILSRSSQLSLSSDSGKGPEGNGKEVLSERGNLTETVSAVEDSDLKKRRTSTMCKSNRISIAEAINITELQRSTKMEAIQSVQSLQSNKSSPLDLNTKNRLVSQHSEHLSDFYIKGSNKIKRKKISILMSEELNLSTSLFSEQKNHLSLTQIKLPKLALNQVMLQVFFDPPSPYLVNLSLCLLCKCLSRRSIKLSLDCVGWLLGISTIVAYKLYQDQPIQGLIEWFCEGMKMEFGQLVKLERWFLGSLNYQAAVSSRQYHNMLMKLMAQK